MEQIMIILANLDLSNTFIPEINIVVIAQVSIGRAAVVHHVQVEKHVMAQAYLTK